MALIDSCQPVTPPTGGPPQATALPVSVYERPLIEGSNTAKCMRLWTMLRGAGSDFDDLSFAVAEAFGFQPDPKMAFPESLDAVCEFADTKPWRIVRRIAVDVFFDSYDRPDDVCYETDQHDWRTWDQRVADAQFDDGLCRWCALDIDGGPEGHRELSGIVASGRKKVADIEALVAELRG